MRALAPFLSGPAPLGYGPRASPAGKRMKSRMTVILTLLGLSLALAACDKCGNFEGIRVPGQPHACKDLGGR